MGFFKLTYGKKASPVKLMLEPSVYFNPDHFSHVDFNCFLIKAKNANVYLLKRESASEWTNFVVTRNFKQFTKISELAPQKAYNWLTTELIRWNAFDGHPSSGILYKPENFDSTKKYPVIFYFYERVVGWTK